MSLDVSLTIRFQHPLAWTRARDPHCCITGPMGGVLPFSTSWGYLDLFALPEVLPRDPMGVPIIWQRSMSLAELEAITGPLTHAHQSTNHSPYATMLAVRAEPGDTGSYSQVLDAPAFYDELERGGNAVAEVVMQVLGW